MYVIYGGALHTGALCSCLLNNSRNKNHETTYLTFSRSVNTMTMYYLKGDWISASLIDINLALVQLPATGG